MTIEIGTWVAEPGAGTGMSGHNRAPGGSPPPPALRKRHRSGGSECWWSGTALVLVPVPGTAVVVISLGLAIRGQECLAARS